MGRCMFEMGEEIIPHVYALLWVELCLLQKSYVEILSPNTLFGNRIIVNVMS